MVGALGIGRRESYWIRAYCLVVSKSAGRRGTAGTWRSRRLDERSMRTLWDALPGKRVTER